MKTDDHIPLNTTEGNCSLNFVEAVPLSCDLRSCAQTDTHVRTITVLSGSVALVILSLEYGSPFPPLLSVFPQVFPSKSLLLPMGLGRPLGPGQTGMDPVGTDQYNHSLNVGGCVNANKDK